MGAGRQSSQHDDLRQTLQTRADATANLVDQVDELCTVFYVEHNGLMDGKRIIKPSKQ